MIKPNSSTKLCAVIGKPIAHSLSPAMHNAAFSALGLNFVYLAFEVERVDLAISGVRGLGIRGLSVTIPHKVEVMKYLDEIDPLAEKIGAVNTVVNEDGHLRGYNTDAIGALRALNEAGIELEDAHAVILGAGGSARAVAFALSSSGIGRITLLARTRSKAEEVKRNLSLHFPDVEVFIMPFSQASMETVIKPGILLINCTPIGMHPEEGDSPVAEELLRGDICVFDLVYNPPETCLMKIARRLGCRVASGLDMLVYQGAEQFELWTGVSAPVDVMKKALLESLGR